MHSVTTNRLFIYNFTHISIICNGRIGIIVTNRSLFSDRIPGSSYSIRFGALNIPFAILNSIAS